MKVTTTLLALFCAALVSAQGQVPLQDAVDDLLNVPGKNPLKYCKDPKENKYVLQLSKLDLFPDPPEPGQNLTIHALGNLTHEVKNGSTVHIEVKLGFVSLLKFDFDLCDKSGALNETCPFHAGRWDVEKEVEMPKGIPPAEYTVKMQAYMSREKEKEVDELITCMEGKVHFKV